MTGPESDFGRSPHNPICVGGGILFGAMNERFYLKRLRSRHGHELEVERVGSVSVDGTLGPIDDYILSGPGLDAPTHLFFDIYSSGPLDPPSGFTVDNPDEPLNLPRTLVRTLRQSDEPPFEEREPRRWRILDDRAQTFGFVTWTGGRDADIDLPRNTAALMREQLGHFLDIAPAEHLEMVLEDFFERFLPLVSEGAVRGAPDRSNKHPGRWQGAIWGDDT